MFFEDRDTCAPEFKKSSTHLDLSANADSMDPKMDTYRSKEQNMWCSKCTCMLTCRLQSGSGGDAKSIRSANQAQKQQRFYRHSDTAKRRTGAASIVHSDKGDAEQ